MRAPLKFRLECLAKARNNTLQIPVFQLCVQARKNGQHLRSTAHLMPAKSTGASSPPLVKPRGGLMTISASLRKDCSAANSLTWNPSFRRPSGPEQSRLTKRVMTQLGRAANPPTTMSVTSAALVLLPGGTRVQHLQAAHFRSSCHLGAQ